MESLTDAELAYHAQLLAEMKATQAAWQSWCRHLASRYRLGPQDSISEVGVVERAAEPTQPEGNQA